MAKPKLNLVIWKHLPEKGAPGDLYYVKDGVHQGEIYIAARNGVLAPVNDIFNIVVPIGPAGRDGRDGRDGIDGKTVVGAKGDKGDPGDVLLIGADKVVGAVQKVQAARIQERIETIVAVSNALAAVHNPIATKIALTKLKQKLEGY
jgi:hypothetical protein